MGAAKNQAVQAPRIARTTAVQTAERRYPSEANDPRVRGNAPDMVGPYDAITSGRSGPWWFILPDETLVVPPADHRPGMVRTDGRIENPESPLENLQGLLVVALHHEAHPQVIERHCGLGLFGTEPLFLDNKGTAIERDRLTGPASGMRDCGQVVEGHGNLIVIRAERAFEDPERLPVQPFRFIILLLCVEKSRQSRLIGRHRGVVRAQRPLAQFHGSAREDYPAFEAAAGMCQA